MARSESRQRDVADFKVNERVVCHREKEGKRMMWKTSGRM